MTRKDADSSDKCNHFQEYFKEIRTKYLTKDYTELSLRTPLENLIEGLSKDYNLMQEPKRTEGVGAPDFKAFRKTVKIGYIETKDLNKNLDEELKSEQIEKYSNSIDNLILTNYVRFILLRGNRLLFDFNLFAVSDLENSRFFISEEKIEETRRLIETFFDYSLPTIRSAAELSFELSKKTKLLKVLAKNQFEEDVLKIRNSEPASTVHDFYDGVKELIKDINLDDCADAYAQTITYGLFLAKMNCPNMLDRNSAAAYIPHSIGIIKRIFMNISGDSLPSNLSWLIDEIIGVLNASNMQDILSEIDSRGKKDRDPFTFFYEDFLSTYNPEKKKRLGVYYTPRPVVSFIVNSINQILKGYFGKPNGFADDDVTVLDPAVGTGTFLWLIYTLSLVELKNKGLGGLIPKKIENHILRDFYGLEILITPYVIAHLKLALALKKWFYEIKGDDRIQVFLSNTLEPSEIHGLMPFLREITYESQIANELKLKRKILVITGNPPYRGLSSNKGQWIDALLKKGYRRNDGSQDSGYYTVDGKPLDEKNPKWLQDDYVKFIRFAQWKIDIAGEGILGFVTNHGYIDNPTFRGMRQSLLSSFDRIYIMNLHGNSLKKEKSPDGSKDENVFDIQQGVAIGIFIKNLKIEDKKVYYADLFGKRDVKYSWLDIHNITNVKWNEAKPKSPDYFFYPVDVSLRNEYGKFWKITDIFEVSSVGVVTGRDELVLCCTREELVSNIRRFSDRNLSDNQIKQMFNLADTKNWKVSDARNYLESVDDIEKQIVRINYRPFDLRWLYYDDALLERSRKSTMEHILAGGNICLIYTRSISAGKPFDHVFCSSSGILGRFYPDSSCITYFSPLYANDNRRIGQTSKPTSLCKKANINPKFMECLTKIHKKDVTPEEIFHYIYSVLHSKTYRARYLDYLKVDFPRIPIVEDIRMFTELVEIGKQLVDLHLMRAKLETSVTFDVTGSNIVTSVKYSNKKVYINDGQFFDGVSQEAWNYSIGTYQVLDQWLKSRKNRELTGAEIELYMQIVETINKTLECVQRIDEIQFLQ